MRLPHASLIVTCALCLEGLFLFSCTSSPRAPSPSIVEKPYSAQEKKISLIQHTSEMPGLHVEAHERQQLKFSYTQGVRALEKDGDLRATDKFHLGAAAQPFIAVMVAQMIDLKLWHWDTPLRELLSADVPVHPSHRDTTIAMMLAHRSGFIDLDKIHDKIWARLPASASAQKKWDVLVKEILKSPAAFTPDTKAAFSAGDYLILAWLLQQQTKFGWEDLVKNRLFIPLDMASCGFGDASMPTAKEPEQPWGHAVVDGRLSAIAPGLTPNKPTVSDPAGTIYCNMEDWRKFLRIVSEGFYHESTFLQPETFDKLLSQSDDSPYTYSGFLRFERSWAAGPALVITGNDSMNYAFAAIAPAREYTILLATNSGAKEAEQGAARIIQVLTELQ